MQTVRCTLCPPETWLPVEGIIDHFEQAHTDKALARWPDGTIVVLNEDELENR